MTGGPHRLCSQPPFLSPLQLQSLPYDERPLPAVHKQPGAAAVEPEDGDRDMSEAPRGATAGEPERLTEKALREASSAVDVLGEALVKTTHVPGGGGGGRGTDVCDVVHFPLSS